MNPIENPPTRAPYGSGSITALPNGRFRVRVRLAGGRRVSQVCPTEGDAKRLRAALCEELVSTQPDAVPEPLKQERLERLMAHQEAISATRLQQKIGRSLEVLVDAVDEEGPIARSAGEAPEIDGVIYLDAAPDVKPGDKLRVVVTDADEHDLYAEPAG